MIEKLFALDDDFNDRQLQINWSISMLGSDTSYSLLRELSGATALHEAA